MFLLSTSKIRTSFFLQIFADTITGETVVEYFVDKMHFPDLVLLFTSAFCYLPSLRFPYSSLVLILLFLLFSFAIVLQCTSLSSRRFFSLTHLLLLFMSLLASCCWGFFNLSENNFEIGDIFLTV